MIIPGWLICILTFPGVIIHEAAHQLFCRLGRVAVLDVCYFRVGNPAGYVLHEPADRFNISFLIAVGPLVVNTVLCFLLCFPAFVPVRVFNREDPLLYFLLWLGVSIGMHAFPSTGDANNLWVQAKAAVREQNPLAFLCFPLIIAIYVANLGRILWADYFYGLAVGLGLPELILDHVL